MTIIQQNPKDSSIFKRSGTLLFKKYREFLFPTILASMTSSMAIIVDGIIVGNMLGAKEMASVSLCIPAMQFFFTFAVLIGMGSSTLIACAIGENKLKDASNIFSTAIITVVALGIFLTAISVPFSSQIAAVLSADIELVPLVNDYLNVILWGSVFIIITPVLSYSIRTDGKAKLASILLIVANVSNLILDLVFIGIFDMGITGSAQATICGYIIGILTVIFYFRSKQRNLKFSLSLITDIKKLIKNLLGIIKTGIPGALSSTLIVLKVLFINQIIGSVAGSNGLIVLSVCFSALSFLSMFISGTAGSMMPILGVLFGQKDFRGARLIFNYTLKLATSLTLAIIIIFEVFPTEIFALFGVNAPEVLSIGIPSLRLYAISLMGVTISYTLIYYYMTVGKQKIANMLSALEGLLIVVPLAWILSFVWGINGIWIGFILAEICALTTIYFVSKHYSRKSNGKYDDFLLIEHFEPGVLYDISLVGSEENASKIALDAGNILKNNGISDSHALQICIVLEEMVIYACNNNKKVAVDIMISETIDNAIISFRDNGKWFNPLDHKESDIYIDGITLLKKIASEIKYNRVLNLNQTLVVISKN